MLEIDNNPVLTVGELNLQVRNLIERGMPLLWVRGEISNFVQAASGHWYFSLKDEQAQVRCVMFRHKSRNLDWKPGNGKQVEVQGLATLYEARGDFQLVLERMRPAGLGALYEAFEQLKKKLDVEGLFDASRKRPLPFLPRRVGIVTSAQAAALRDVLTTLSKRMPAMPVVLYPVPVQGEGAGQKIAQAIRVANERAECDVLIVCRGGGSIEDLWAFNEEVVARAIAESSIPVVSGVGHETDFTIADFVADLRAPTPTAAAQHAVPDRSALLAMLREQAQHLCRAQRNRLQNAAQAVDYLQRRLVHPAQQLHNRTQQLWQFHGRLRRAFEHASRQQDWRWQAQLQRLRQTSGIIERMGQRHANLAFRLGQALRVEQEQRRLRLDHVTRQFDLLNPERVLARGYSLVQDLGGHVVSDAGRVAVGETLRITFARGRVHAEVLEKD